MSKSEQMGYALFFSKEKNAKLAAELHLFQGLALKSENQLIVDARVFLKNANDAQFVNAAYGNEKEISRP